MSNQIFLAGDGTQSTFQIVFAIMFLVIVTEIIYLIIVKSSGECDSENLIGAKIMSVWGTCMLYGLGAGIEGIIRNHYVNTVAFSVVIVVVIIGWFALNVRIGQKINGGN